jgi:cytosine permease
MAVDTERDRTTPALEEEFEHEPVPQDRRKPLLSVAAVWFGFPMILTCAIFGGIIVGSLGFSAGMLAILIGNLVLAAYVGLLSYRAGETGRSFALQAQQTFGRLGYVLVSGFLATLVIGWFAVQTGLTGATMQGSFGANELIVTLIAGVLYVAVTFVGIRALVVLGWIAAPLFVVLSLVAIFMATRENGLGNILGYTPNLGGGAAALSFGAAITLTIATFIDSGTMTADFTRWAKDGRQGALSAFFAFPVAMFFAMLVGGVVVASGAVGDPLEAGGDFLPILAGGGPVLAVLAGIFVFVNLGSVCTHCLYNGAVGWSHITGGKMRFLTLVLGAVGTLLALAGVWNLFLDWLNLLGIVVPPLGAIIIVDQLVLRRSRLAEAVPAWRPTAFVAWAVAAAAALLVNGLAPQLSVAVVGMVAAIAVYVPVTLVARRRGLDLPQEEPA